MILSMLLAAALAAQPEPPPRSMGRTGYFAVNAAALDEQARGLLNALADWLMANPASTAAIEGHADARGARDHNLALARRRAEAVRDYLVARGVAPGRLTAISFGEERPALYDY